ncbi:MAG: M23 family metallopeptidase [Candidatus Helarchaeota archaeon]
MKKKYKIILLVVIILGGSTFIYLLYLRGFFFSSWGRYDESKLEMEAPWEKAEDIHSWNEGYSESDDCPWGFEHRGLDFFFNDSDKVLAIAPGYIESIELVDFGGDENRYHIKVNIRFSREFLLVYGFEPWTTSKSDAEKQLDELKIKEGDWVKTGGVIANFVGYTDSAHIHFDLYLNGEQTCPKNYFSDEAYDEIMSLIHKYHDDWEMCYD